MKQRVLICGASFAGLSTAFWMQRLGHNVTIIDIAAVRVADRAFEQRGKLLVLTPEGRQKLEAIRARQAVWANALGGGFGESELREAASLLGRVLDALKTEGNADGPA